MQFSSLFTVLATGLAFVAAQDIETTTTSTSTLTKTLTITQCNPTVTNCPLRTNSSTVAPTTSSVWSYSAKNTTVSASPTGYANSTTYAVPTTKAPSTSTPAASTTKSAATSAATVSTSSAGSLMVQSGLLLSVLGAGVALLA